MISTNDSTDDDLSISQIALNLGYTDTEHIARYIRKEKGLSPQDFRKKFGQK